MKENDGFIDRIFEQIEEKRLFIGKILIFLSFFSVIFALCFSTKNFLSDALLSFGAYIKGRSLNENHWHNYFKSGFGAALIFLAGSLFCFFQSSIQISQKRKSALTASCFFVFAALTFITVLFHEPWRDEIHAWFLAGNYSVPRLFYEMRYEGHFLLWYLILMPFAKLGFPLITLNLISWVIFCASALFFLIKSPFRLSAKILALFSNAFLFWYPVVSRCYVLIPPLLFILASIYEERENHLVSFAVILALLANTHAYIEGFVGIVTLLFFIQNICLKWKTDSSYQKVKKIVSLTVILAGVLVAFLQVAPAFFVPDKSSVAGLNFDFFAFDGFLSGSYIYLIFWPVFVLTLIFLFCVLFKKDKIQFLIFLCSLIYMLAFAALIYGSSVSNRMLLWFFLMIFSLWTSKIDFDKKNIFLILFALLLLRPSLNLRDWKEDFSPWKSAKNYIENSYPKGTPVFIVTEHQTATFAQLLSKEYPAYHLSSGKPVKLFSFSSDYNPHEEKTYDDYVGYLLASRKFDFPILVIASDEVDFKNYKFSKKTFTGFIESNLLIFEIEGKLEKKESQNESQ